ncbi:MAG: tripartite tricarboxylate transporter TctB family protein [Oscillospiraceae bacterium]
MKMRKIFLDKNFLAGTLAVIIGACIIAIYGFKFGVYPVAVFAILIALGIALIITAFYKQGQAPMDKIMLRELLVIALLFVNPIIANYVGFYVSGAIAVYIIMLLFSPPTSIKQAGKTALYCAAVAVVVYLIFTILLHINTPRGFLI